MAAATMTMTMACEEAAPMRRSRSVGLRGRFGDSEECLGVSSESNGFRVVVKNTFLDLELDMFDDDCECEKDDCCSEPSSDVTTEPPSTLWSDHASEGSESEHGDEMTVPVAGPPGNFAVSNVAMYYVPTMMVAVPAASCASADQPEEAQQKKRFATCAWGAQRKNNNPRFDTYTTIMIKNLPAECTNTMMVDMLDAAGLSGKYDFVYAPTDFRTYTAFGYAFVNLSSHKNAVVAMDVLDGLTCPLWSEQAAPFEVCWSEPHQGLKVHIKRYQNSPVMHPDVLEQYKPLLFKNGARQLFPVPTKRIREPRLRRSNPTDAQ